MEGRRQIKRNARTTIDQLNAFLTFLEANPEFFRSNPFKRDSKYTNGKWNELTFILNSLRGPTKKPKEWKISLIHWKNQLKSRTRKLRTEHFIETDDGTCSQNLSLTPLEERALSLFGELPVEYKEIKIINHTIEDSNLIESQRHTPSPDMSIKIETHDESEDSEPAVDASRKRTSSNSMEATYKRPRFDESRDEFDRRMSEERLEIDRLNCDAANKMANAVSKIADALLIFAKAYADK